MSRLWTEDEIAFLVDNYGKRTWKYLIAKLNRTMFSIKNKVEDLGLNLEEDCFYSLKEVSRILGVNTYQVKKWFDSKVLKASKLNCSHVKSKKHYKYKCYPNDLIDFLEANKNLWDKLNIDKFQLSMAFLNYNGTLSKDKLNELKSNLT